MAGKEPRSRSPPCPHSGSGLIRRQQPGQGLGKVTGSQGTIGEAVALKAICGEWAKVFSITLVRTLVTHPLNTPSAHNPVPFPLGTGLDSITNPVALQVWPISGPSRTQNRVGHVLGPAPPPDVLRSAWSHEAADPV